MTNEDKKNTIVKMLTNLYTWCKGRGWNETVIKVILGAIFGIAATFILSGCSLSYESASQKLDVEIIPVQDWKK